MQALPLFIATVLAIGPASPAEHDADPTEAKADDTSDADPEPSEPETAAGDDTIETEAAGENQPESEPEPEPEPEAESDPEPEPEPETPVPAPIADGTPNEVDVAPPTRDRLGCSGSRTCKRMTVGGIVLGSLGLIGVGTGVGLLANPDRVDEDLPIYVISTRPAGLVALTVSAGITVTAILMLVAAHRGYKQRDTASIELIPGGLRF